MRCCSVSFAGAIAAGRLAPAALVLLLVLCVGSPALAHTTVRLPVTEGTRADSALRIAHGCGDNPVRAQSVVFPTDSPELAASDPTVVINDLGEIIEQGDLASLVNGVQDRSIFEKQREKVDGNGNEIGFYATRGNLLPELSGRVPFEVTAPSFVPSSCAARLFIEAAVADICIRRAPSLQTDRVNLWIPDNGSQFAIDGQAGGVEGIGEPARLVVLRNLETNPLPPSCGAGFTVTVTPSPAQIDRDLPFPGWPVKRRAR